MLTKLFQLLNVVEGVQKLIVWAAAGVEKLSAAHKKRKYEKYLQKGRALNREVNGATSDKQRQKLAKKLADHHRSRP